MIGKMGGKSLITKVRLNKEIEPGDKETKDQMEEKRKE